jgi:hypothetical protein
MASGLEMTTKVRETRKKPTTMTSSRNRRDSCRRPRTSFGRSPDFILPLSPLVGPNPREREACENSRRGSPGAEKETEHRRQQEAVRLLGQASWLLRVPPRYLGYGLGASDQRGGEARRGGGGWVADLLQWRVRRGRLMAACAAADTGRRGSC